MVLWRWKFSSTYSPQHTYTTPGTYITSLAVNDGCSYDTISQIIEVFPIPNSNFIFSDSVLCGNNTFNFNVNSSNVSTFWDFGDGNQSNLSNPSHNYQSPGIYNVVLTVTSLTNGCINSDSTLVESLIVPTSNVTPSTYNGCLPLQVIFTNNSTNANYFSWDFGDGNSSVFVNGSHTYTNPGLYNVELISTSVNGCSDSSIVNIEVYPLPSTDFTYNNSDFCYPPATVQFFNNSSGASAYSWNFDNGTHQH